MTRRNSAEPLSIWNEPPWRSHSEKLRERPLMASVFGAELADVIAADLRRLPLETRKKIRPKLRRVGGRVAAAAKANASWSSRIPATVRVVTSFRFEREGVAVKLGGRGTPHARPYEGLTRDPFRHPVNADPRKTRGEWTWVSQAARPMLRPAARANEAETNREMLAALDEAARELGFR